MDQLQRQQLTEALMQVAFIESKALSVGLAEITAYLQRKEHLPALGTFQGLDQKFKFLGTVAEVMDVATEDGTQLGFVILRTDNTVEIVDTVIGERVRIKFGPSTRRRR